LLEVLIVSDLVRKYPTYIQSVGSLPYSQDPDSCPVLSEINPVHVFYSISWRSILLFSFHRRLWLPSGLHSSGIPAKTSVHLYFPLTCNVLMSNMNVQMWGIWSLCAVCILKTPHLKTFVNFHEISY